MSTSTEDVLGEIDGALSAWGTVSQDPYASPDAMRWSPEKPGLVICDGGGSLALSPPQRFPVTSYGAIGDVAESLMATAAAVWPGEVSLYQPSEIPSVGILVDVTRNGERQTYRVAGVRVEPRSPYELHMDLEPL